MVITDGAANFLVNMAAAARLAGPDLDGECRELGDLVSRISHVDEPCRANGMTAPAGKAKIVRTFRSGARTLDYGPYDAGRHLPQEPRHSLYSAASHHPVHAAGQIQESACRSVIGF